MRDSDQEIQRRTDRRVKQDRFLAVQQAYCDGSVAENTDKRGGWRGMKYARAQFTVVTASDAFRAGYDQIAWTSQAPRPDSTAPLGVQGGRK